MNFHEMNEQWDHQGLLEAGREPMGEIDTKYTTCAICPYCGYVNRDSWEIGEGEEGDFDVECGSCDKPFRCSRHITVRYTTTK